MKPGNVPMPIDRHKWPYLLRLYHGPVPCPRRGCPGEPGDLLIEMVHKSLGSVQVEMSVCRSRVDNPSDHAGRFDATGPDLHEVYPAWEVSQSSGRHEADPAQAEMDT